MSEQRPRKPGSGYFRNPSNRPVEQSSRKPVGSYFRQPEPTPASPEDMQATIPEKDRQTEAQRQQATREPIRYQPPAGQSRLGRQVVKDAQTGEYIQSGEYVDFPQASRLQGLYIIGIQGFGKSGLIENLIIQDIKQNIGVCVLDPHGELIDHVIARLPDREKEEKVILLDITDKDFFFGLNLFACTDPTDDREIQYTLNQVTHVFEKAFGITRTNPRMYDYLYNCAYTLIANPGLTMVDIRLLLTNAACRSQLVGNVTDDGVLDFWHTYFNPLSEGKQREESREILRRLNDLTHDPLRYIIGQSQSTINLQQIMDEGKILLVKLNSKRFAEATKLIGSILVAQILNASDTRLTKRQFNLYADEFQRFATEDFATLIEEARKAAIGITMAHQNRGQLELNEKQADANLKQRTLSVGNLVVFRVPTDADSLAGQFTQEPEAARIEMLKPQEHERKEEQVEVEVEEDIEEIPLKPVEYLVSSSRSHVDPKVREAANNIVSTIRSKTYPRKFLYHDSEEKDPELLLNTMLVDVMEGRLPLITQEFAERVAEIAIHASRQIGWLTDAQYTLWFGGVKRAGMTSIATEPKPLKKCLIDEISLHVRGISSLLAENIWYALIPKLVEDYQMNQPTHRQSPVYFTKKDYEEAEKKLRAYEERLFKNMPEEMNNLLSFIYDIRILCAGLAAVPLKVPTGKKRVVKRIQPHITYLTHESEKITHQQPSEQEMTNRMVRELINLPLYTARVKISTAAGIKEHAIHTLEPEKGIRGNALQQRIDSIKERNIEEGYLRKRTDVDEEIKLRQQQYSKSPEDEEPPEDEPVTRRPRN